LGTKLNAPTWQLVADRGADIDHGSAIVRVLEGHGHICLLAPGIDLARNLDPWQPTSPGR
jgi:hypothetical protein